MSPVEKITSAESTPDIYVGVPPAEKMQGAEKLGVSIATTHPLLTNDSPAVSRGDAHNRTAVIDRSVSAPPAAVVPKVSTVNRGAGVRRTVISG